MATNELSLRLNVKCRWHFKLWLWLGFAYVYVVALYRGDADKAIDRAARLVSRRGMKITLERAAP